MRTDYGAYLPGQSDWAVVNTHPHKERLALDNLERQSYRTYCPLLRKRIGRGARARDVLRPLFPGYVFVQVAAERACWRPIMSTYGVRSLVLNGDRIGMIEDHFVAGLRQREVDGVISRPARPFEVGENVSIAGGPFDGLIATIVSLDDRDRLVVLMNLLNRPVKVKLEAVQLSPVPLGERQ
jgi:transcriptional antiterminator RfaH